MSKIKEFYSSDDGYTTKPPENNHIETPKDQYDLDLTHTLSKSNLIIESKKINKEEEPKVYQEMHDYFFEKLLIDSIPNEIDFESIGEYYQNIQIKDTIHIGDDGNYKKAKIEGYLLRALIDGKKYFLYTKSLDEKNKVKHLNIDEIRFLLTTNNESNNNIYDIQLEKIKKIINNRLLQIENKPKFKKLIERLKK